MKRTHSSPHSVTVVKLKSNCSKSISKKGHFLNKNHLIVQVLRVWFCTSGFFKTRQGFKYGHKSPFRIYHRSLPASVLPLSTWSTVTDGILKHFSLSESMMLSFVSRGRRRNIAGGRGLLWFWGAVFCFYLLPSNRVH